MRDVIVVGAGPVGGQAARLLAEKGLDVLLVEEHERVGEPVQCAGLFTPRIFDLVDFPLSRVHMNDIRGAHVYAPDGHHVTLDGGKTMAVAIDRAGFDQAVVESAVKRGADLHLGTKVMAARRRNGNVEATLVRNGGSRTEEARLLVGADGVQSRVAKWFGLPHAREIVPCYGAQMAGLKAADPAFVEMFVGREQAPGFFSWIIPTDPSGSTGKVEVGVAYDAPRPAKHYWDRMFRDPLSARFLPEPKAAYDICGCIPLGAPRRTTADNVMLVGDAASQAKPTSGGGVYTGLKCAAHLADVAAEAIEAGDASNGALKEYHARWSRDVGWELKVGMRLRRAFMHLDDEQISELFRILDDPDILATVNALGDIDYPSRLARGLLRKAPELFKFSGAFVKSLFD